MSFDVRDSVTFKHTSQISPFTFKYNINNKMYNIKNKCISLLLIRGDECRQRGCNLLWQIGCTWLCEFLESSLGTSSSLQKSRKGQGIQQTDELHSFSTCQCALAPSPFLTSQ